MPKVCSTFGTHVGCRFLSFTLAVRCNHPLTSSQARRRSRAVVFSSRAQDTSEYLATELLHNMALMGLHEGNAYHPSVSPARRGAENPRNSRCHSVSCAACSDARVVEDCSGGDD